MNLNYRHFEPFIEGQMVIQKVDGLYCGEVKSVTIYSTSVWVSLSWFYKLEPDKACQHGWIFTDVGVLEYIIPSPVVYVAYVKQISRLVMNFSDGEMRAIFLQPQCNLISPSQAISSSR